jgi:hypothetical protein
MQAYTTPTITEVGTVRGMTLEGQFAVAYDGQLWRGDTATS